MRQAELRRCFSADFITHLTHARAWPAQKLIKCWAIENYGSAWDTNSYSAARGGRYVSESHIIKFINYARRATGNAGEEAYIENIRNSWNQFIVEKTEKTLFEISDADAMNALCCAPQPVSSLRRMRDKILDGPRWVYDVLKLTTKPWRFFEICPKEDVELAVRWIYVDSARRNIRSDLPANDAVAAAEADTIRCPIAEYTQHAHEWRDASPLSIAFAIDRGTRIGVCIALPVTDDAYAHVRAGSLNSCQCRMRDLTRRSPQLILEAFAMRPGELATATMDPTRCLLIAYVSQQAGLTDVDGIGDEVPLRLLAIGGTSENCDRLVAHKFQPTGTKLAGTKFDLYERRLYDLNRSRIDTMIASAWWGLQRLLRKGQ